MFLYLSSSFVSDTLQDSVKTSLNLFTSNVFLFIEDSFVQRIVLDLKIRGLIPLCCVDFIVENKWNFVFESPESVFFGCIHKTF